MPNRNQFCGLIDSIVAETHQNADLSLGIYFCHKITRNLNRILLLFLSSQAHFASDDWKYPPTPVLYLNIHSGVGVLLPWRLPLRWNQCSGVSGFWRRVATSQTGRLMGTGRPAIGWEKEVAAFTLSVCVQLLAGRHQSSGADDHCDGWQRETGLTQTFSRKLMQPCRSEHLHDACETSACARQRPRCSGNLEIFKSASRPALVCFTDLIRRQGWPQHPLPRLPRLPRLRVLREQNPTFFMVSVLINPDFYLSVF